MIVVLNCDGVIGEDRRTADVTELSNGQERMATELGKKVGGSRRLWDDGDLELRLGSGVDARTIGHSDGDWCMRCMIGAGFRQTGGGNKMTGAAGVGDESDGGGGGT